MGLLKTYLQQRKLSKAIAAADKILSLIAPFINATGQLAENSLRRSIGSWSLSNPTLVNYLGYVAGVIDAADNALGHSSTKDWTATEIVFHQVIEAQLDWINGSEPIIKMNRIGFESGGTFIGGLQKDPQFLAAMQLGGQDFLSLSSGQPGYYPKGLSELGLITFGKPAPAAEGRR